MTTPLIEAIKRAMRPKLSECIALSLNGNPNKWKQAEEILSQAALTAIAEAGYAVVPVEPTEAMRSEGADRLFASAVDDWGDEAADIYRAMINAVTHCNHTNNGKAE